MAVQPDGKLLVGGMFTNFGPRFDRYNLNGTIDLLGFTEQIETAFKEVHRTNMTKFLSSLSEVQRTVEDYTNAGVKCNYIEKNGKYAIIREDGKLIKPIGWEKPNL
jgi:hypothetical protein